MKAHANVEMGSQPLNLPLQPISVSTIYAWTRVWEGYSRRHAAHQLEIYYHRELVRDLKRLVRYNPQLDPAGFSVRVQAPDGNLGDIPQLLSLFERAAGPERQRFLTDDDSNAWFAQATAANPAG